MQNRNIASDRKIRANLYIGAHSTFLSSKWLSSVRVIRVEAGKQAEEPVYKASRRSAQSDWALRTVASHWPSES